MWRKNDVDFLKTRLQYWFDNALLIMLMLCRSPKNCPCNMEYHKKESARLRQNEKAKMLHT